jgi:hypothetical protein
MSNVERVAPYAKVIARLLQSDIDDEDRHWKDLLHFQIPLIEYFEKMGLELVVIKQDEYAFLRQMQLDEDGSTVGLIRRTSLPFEISIMCVLLRELLFEFEIKDSLSKKLYIKHSELKERVELFFKEQSDKVRFLKNLDVNIKKLVEDFGFMRIADDGESLTDRRYLVKPILKSKITLDKLQEFKNDLSELC